MTCRKKFAVILGVASGLVAAAPAMANTPNPPRGCATSTRGRGGRGCRSKRIGHTGTIFADPVSPG